MKIDLCLVSSDLNETYYLLYPLVKKVWETKFGIKVVYILVADVIPTALMAYKNDIILFKPIDGIHHTYIAQVIRLLYPALFPDKNCIISDMDILPISKKYFIDSIIPFDDTKFICYRDAYLNQEMIGMCYNVAKGELWGKIFDISNIDDINKKLVRWYNNEYTGTKNCPGWYTDQKTLYEYVYGKEFTVILKDSDLKFKRLDKRDRQYIVKLEKDMIDKIKDETYTDFHLIRPYTRPSIRRIINIIGDNILGK